MECVIIKEIVDYYRKIDKVKGFLISVIRKMRYEKIKASSILIQKYMKGFATKKRIK